MSHNTEPDGSVVAIIDTRLLPITQFEHRVDLHNNDSGSQAVVLNSVETLLYSTDTNGVSYRNDAPSSEIVLTLDTFGLGSTTGRYQINNDFANDGIFDQVNFSIWFETGQDYIYNGFPDYMGYNSPYVRVGAEISTTDTDSATGSNTTTSDYNLNVYDSFLGSNSYYDNYSGGVPTTLDAPGVFTFSNELSNDGQLEMTNTWDGAAGDGYQIWFNSYSAYSYYGYDYAADAYARIDSLGGTYTGPSTSEFFSFRDTSASAPGGEEGSGTGGNADTATWIGMGTPFVPAFSNVATLDTTLVVSQQGNDGQFYDVIDDSDYPDASEFLDLRSSDLVDAGYIYLGGVGSQESNDDGTAARPNYDQIISFSGDAFDVASEFAGVIVSGSSDYTASSHVLFVGAEDVSDVVVFAGGYGVDVDLGGGYAADVISFRGRDEGVQLTLSDAGSSTATLDSGETVAVNGAEIVIGSAADDVITGYASQENIIAGGNGNDTITGGDSGDVLLGGSGYNDILGGNGDDLIINLGTGRVDGGPGDDQDVFVVRGLDAENPTYGARVNAQALDDHSLPLGDYSEDGIYATTTKIANFSVSEEGLSRQSRSTDNHEDRIVFNVSAAAVSMMATDLAIAVADLDMATGFNTDRDIYDQITDNLVVDVNAVPLDQSLSYVTELWYEALSGDYLLLGRAEFELDITGSATVVEKLNGVILDQLNVYAGAPEGLAHALSTSDPLSASQSAAAGAAAESTEFFTDGTMNITVAFERFDPFAVVGDGSGIMLAARNDDGDIVATRFRGSEADEVMVATRFGDTVQIFNDETVLDYGVDVLVELGSEVASPATTYTDVNGSITRTSSDGDSIQIDLTADALLAGSLDLSRFERAREGDDASLRIQHDGTEMSAFTQVVFNQYGDNDMFRTEDLALLTDDSGNNDLSYYSLGQVTDTGLTLSGGADGIFVGDNYGVAETFEVTVDAGDRGAGGYFDQDIYLFDFDEMNDRIDITGDYTIDSATVMTTGYDVDNDQVIDGTEVSMGTTQGDTLSFYFIGNPGLTQEVFDDIALLIAV